MRLSLNVRIFILVLAAIVLLHAVGWLSPIEHGISLAVRPAQRFFSSLIPMDQPPQSDDPQKRIRDLETLVSRLMTENILLKEERRQDAALRNQDAFLASQNLHGIPATIIGRSPEGDTQVILLDQGTEKGISPGQPVVTENGIFVGKIEEAEQGRSSAILITDSRSSVAAEVENQERSPGLVSGQHGLTMRMRFIPQNEAIEKNQAIVTSALDARIPANLPIGVVTDIHFATGDLFQEASLRTLVDLQRLRYVTVIIQ